MEYIHQQNNTVLPFNSKTIFIFLPMKTDEQFAEEYKENLEANITHFPIYDGN